MQIGVTSHNFHGYTLITLKLEEHEYYWSMMKAKLRRHIVRGIHQARAMQ